MTIGTLRGLASAGTASSGAAGISSRADEPTHTAGASTWEQSPAGPATRAFRATPIDTPLPERRWLLLLLTLGTTFEYRIPLGLVSMTIMELLCYMVLPVMFADLVANPRAFKASTSLLWKWNPYAQWYFFWVAFLAVFHIFASADLAILQTFKDMVPPWTLLMFLFLYCRSETAIRTVAMGLLLGGACNGLLGTTQGLLGFPRLLSMSRSTGKMDIDGGLIGALSAPGWFTHPNAFALFLIPFAPLLILVAINRIPFGWVWRCIALGSMPLLAFATIKTYGKGAMLWMFFAMMWSVIPVPAGRLRWHLMFWSTWAGVGLVAGIAIVLSDQYRSLETIFTRTQLWGAAAEALGTDAFYFFFGDAFDRVLQLSYWYTDGHTPYPTAHNGVLNQAVCYGVPGLILFICLIVRGTRRFLIPGNTPHLAAQLPGFTVFVAASIFGLIGEWFFEPASTGVAIPTQLFFLLGLGGVLSIPAIRRPDPVKKN